MYLAIDYNGGYWLFSLTRAAVTTGATVEEAFTLFGIETFNPSNNSNNAIYSLNNGIIYDERDGEKDSTVIAEFPDDTTYTEFKNLYPELLI